MLFTDPVVNAWFAGVQVASREEFEEGMLQNLDGYRSRGLQAKNAAEIRVTPIDGVHTVADVTWTYRYRRSDGTEIPYQSSIAYLVQVRDGVARIFGWLIGRDSRPDLTRMGVIHQG